MEGIKTRIDNTGRIRIPNAFRENLHFSPGKDVILYCEGEEIKIRSVHESMKKARKLIKNYNSENVDLLELLFQQRREENANG